MIIPASEHPKAFEGPTLILNIIMCALGAIIGLELIVRTGVTPNTSIIGALFAIVLSRIPIAFCQKFRSVHRQNLIATSIFRRDLLRGELSAPAHRYSGGHGTPGSGVPDADRRVHRYCDRRYDSLPELRLRDVPG